MKTANVTIGANYGDEGKGLVTDFIASQTDTALVIRHNSSAQAGHTVEAPVGASSEKVAPGFSSDDATSNNERHIFHHIGSGAFVGASTFLGPRFVAHPMLLNEELTTLEALGVTPTIYVDPRTTVAVPYDLLLNQLAEEARGVARHGSCGIGFSEAVERNLRPRFALTVRDFAKPEWVFDRLRAIRDGWLPRRLRALGLTISDDRRALFAGDDILWRWMQDMAAFRARTILTEPGDLPPGTPIFEGAQGLLLDEDSADFPHVTRSKTGLANVIQIAQEGEVEHLTVTYVTRAYLTRHGAGPLANEWPAAPDGVSDPTNQPNDFQGSLRFAPLDLDALAARIRDDLNFRAQGITADARLAVTCLDQMEHIEYIVGGEHRTATETTFIADVEAVTGLPVEITSHGPARSDVNWTAERQVARYGK